MPLAVRATAAVCASNRRQQAAERAKRSTKPRKNKVVPEEEEIELAPEDREFVEGKLKEFDHDGNGTLDSHELKDLMTALNEGVSPSKDEVESILKLCDNNRDGKISMAELKGVVTTWFLCVDANRQDAENGGCSCVIS